MHAEVSRDARVNSERFSSRQKQSLAKLGDLVGSASVGFNPIVFKFGMNAGNEVPRRENTESYCYSMFRDKSVDLVCEFWSNCAEVWVQKSQGQ
jgi:hypothetical protein